MTKILALADMSGLSEVEIKDPIASNYRAEETSKGSLQQRSYFAIGGYDEDSEANTQAIKDYISALPDDA